MLGAYPNGHIYKFDAHQLFPLFHIQNVQIHKNIYLLSAIISITRHLWWEKKESTSLRQLNREVEIPHDRGHIRCSKKVTTSILTMYWIPTKDYNLIFG